MTTYNPLHLLPIPPQPTDPKPLPTALTVDPFSDLLWVGTSTGSTSALCSPSHLTPNVRFPAHRARDLNPGMFMGGIGPQTVKSIRVTDREVWTLTEGGIGGRKRGGMVKWSVTEPLRGLKTMAANPTNSHEVLAGGNNGVIVANTSRGEITRRVDSGSSIVHLAPLQRTVFSAALSGQVSILDPRTGFRTASTISPVQAHTGGMSGADAQSHLVCTWGWTHMSGHPLPDPLVRVYDVRTLRPLPPISFPSGPSFALLHPTDTSKIFISSQQGMMQVYDMSSSTSGHFQQLDVSSYVISMALSSAGDYLAFGDADGQVHLWTTHSTGDDAARNEDGSISLPPFNSYEGVKPDWPDAPIMPPSIAWDEKTPLNVIGMPHYSDPLLSNFTVSDYAPVTSPFFNPPDPIPTSVLSTMQMVDFVGYANLPRDLRGKRYVVSARPGAGKQATGRGYTARKDNVPRFRSAKDRQARPSISGDLDEVAAPGEIPKYYRQVEIKYSKFGVEDFDFGFYNRTKYSGLETDILNSYTNPLLQALHYTTPIRNVAKGHLCVDCKKEHCLLCEAGFLFRMLEDAKGTNCQASNFSRAFSATPQASALGLRDEGDKLTSPYGSLIQSFNRWLLSTFSTESVVEGATFRVKASPAIGSTALETPSAIDQILGIMTTTTNKCLGCGHVSKRNATLQAVDLTYPKKAVETSFGDLVRSAILRENSTKATCSNCKLFAPLESIRRLAGPAVETLPSVISVNAAVSTPEIFEIWRDKRKAGTSTHFLQKQVSILPTEEDAFSVGEGEGAVVYEVKSIVVQVQESPDTPVHLLSFVKMPATEDGEPTWIMFNDFLVRPVPEEEVFRFSDQWKVPAVIILERKDQSNVLDFSGVPSALDPSVLYKDVTVSWNRRKNMIRHKGLEPTELPTPGTLIAIDAEFVALQQEEMEFRSDGTKNILRPSHMSLARVSVLRGEGAKERTPFIDDYIHTSETVVDYLTEYSGIKSGDLDPSSSPYTLVPLKVAYKKLRLLVDLGCIFIGHGLAKDFRTINIFVPPEQIRDTVNIYTIPGRQRKLSLRFLSWFLLKKDIQTNMHDSIEDARYALLLYKQWQDFEKDGRFEDVMEDIFYEGQKLGFKPPQDKTASPAMPPPKVDGPPAPRGTNQTFAQHLQPINGGQLGGHGGEQLHPHRSRGAKPGSHPKRHR